MLTLTLTLDSPIPIEADVVAPDRLQPLSIDAIAALPILHGNRTLQLRDAFDIAGDASDGIVVIEGDCSRVKSLGRGMAGGRLTIRGPAGMHTGAAMRGGELYAHSAGDWLGAEMRGGLIRVASAGDRVGSAYVGGTRGMRGGTIIIDENAGHELGAYMRRGVIAVQGRCGDFTGVGMIAGTVLAFGGCGDKTGAGMKRGTILSGGDVGLPSTFTEACVFEPPFLQLYLRYLWDLCFFTPSHFDTHPLRPLRRFTGDRLALGQGEVLVAS